MSPLNTAVPTPVVEVVETPALPTRVSEQDLQTLQLANTNKTISRLTAEKAISDHNTADMTHRFVTLQVFVKYGLDQSKDTVDESGNIVRG